MTDVLALYARQGQAAASSQRPTALEVQAFPKLLATGEDDTLNGHHSFQVLQALGQHADRMNAVEVEYGKLDDGDRSFKGHSAEQIAQAFQRYANTHHGESLPQAFTASTAALAYATDASSTVVSYASTANAYSWAALLRSMGWAKILYAIVWMVSGLTLLFFGYASFFWLHKVSPLRAQHSLVSGLAQALPGIKNSKKRRQQSRPYLGGGVGGLLIGFLFFSYLTAIIHNGVCVNESRKALAPAAYFAVWLAPGLVGAALGGHVALAARGMTGMLGATCLTTLLTAVFGIETALIRIILISIFTALMTAPLLQQRAKVVQMLVLNAATSLIGMITFLNGVALVAPAPLEPSSNWLDLWTLLFMHDSASDHDAMTNAWGTSVFKGYIAGAVLGAVVGFLFELVLHRRCGHDPEAEWNQYLGTFTQQIEHGTSGAGAFDDDDPTAAAAAAGRAAMLRHSTRAGQFEPAPSAWQRMVDFFDSEKARPAHYGNLSGDGGGRGGAHDGSMMTVRSSSLRQKMQRKRSRQSARGGPARFTALRKHDDEFDDASSGEDDDDEKRDNAMLQSDDDDDDDVSDVEDGSGDDNKKRGERELNMRNVVPSLTKHAGATANFGGYALPVPPSRPSLMTSISSSTSNGSSSTSSNNGGGDSRLTGTTANSGGASNGQLQKPVDRYQDHAVSATSTSSPSPVPATPSLINAISRIQRAQQQAQAWQRQHEAQGAPYNDSPSSPPPPPPTTTTKK